MVQTIQKLSNSVNICLSGHLSGLLANLLPRCQTITCQFLAPSGECIYIAHCLPLATEVWFTDFSTGLDCKL